MPLDTILSAAVEAARDAAIETAGDARHVGEHLGPVIIEDRLVSHLFACTMPGYRGWVWSVTVARAPRAKSATVCEAHLVPADDALLAQPWVPWADRVRPGDLEPSMVLPYIPDDARLVPGYELTSAQDEDAMELWELGLGRHRVLGAEGRSDVADRWYRGSHGPSAASAVASTSPCSTCAFFIPLTGSMRMRFGACANEWSPSDGTVVSVDHGCGAHSETDVERHATQWPDPDPVFENDVSVPLDLDAESEQDAEPVEQDAEPAALASETTDDVDEDATDAPEPTDHVDEAATDAGDEDAPEATDAADEAATEARDAAEPGEPLEVDGDTVETTDVPAEPLPESEGVPEDHAESESPDAEEPKAE